MAEGPRYRQLAEDLRSKILAGEYAVGAKLPSESDLIDQWDLSRGMVRRALALLDAEGLTESRKGSGVFVRDVREYQRLRDFKPIVRVETTRGSAWKHSKSMWEYDIEGREFASDQLKIGYADPPERVARVLDTADAGMRSRRYLVDGQAALLADSYLPADIVRGSRIMEPDTGPGGTYGRLRDLGFEVAAFSMQVWSREATDVESERLELHRVPYVLCAARTAFTDTGRVTEVNEMVMNPTMFVLQFDWDA